MHKNIFTTSFYVRLIDYSILWKARYDELIGNSPLGTECDVFVYYYVIYEKLPKKSCISLQAGLKI